MAATCSSRYVVPNFWRDPASGIGYQVQVEIPPARMDSVKEVEMMPLRATADGTGVPARRGPGAGGHHARRSTIATTCAA